ncbi:riboflavin synthase domain-like protein [Peniophora sp. CONT]|nr:riboflavin synthase domain-like protein [Peniophora sp. CONT]
MTNSNDHDHEQRALTLLYATETGTAQEVADRIARHCRYAGFKCRTYNVEDYPSEDIVDEHLIIFIVATAGTGKEPRTMTPLWTLLLRADLPHDLLEDLHYAVFGLGDSAYERFCWPAKRLDRRLEALGATAICERGEGDSQHDHGTDAALDPWINQLTERLVELYPPSASGPLEPFPQLWPARVTLAATTAEAMAQTRDPILDTPGYWIFTLETNTRITATDWYQDVRHFEFSTDGDLDYEPGDVAVIHPEAPADDVESILQSQGWEAIADDPVSVDHVHKDQQLSSYLPAITTLRTILTKYVDVTAVPKRSFFAIVRNFTSDEREREKMDEFVSTKEGAEDLYEYTSKVRRTIVEVLEEFRNVKIPKDYVFDVFPSLRPREFSIASSVVRHPRKIQLCIAIVSYRTKLRRPRRGIATTYLSDLKPGSKLRIGIKKGLLELPPDPSTPVLCVGPGTGIAPMRSLLETRIHSGSRNNALYFGCRSADKDQHYADDWQHYVEEQTLTYRTAFSRDGIEGHKRLYVQNLVEEDSKQVWEAIGRRDGWVYISGSSNKMPAAVRRALAHAAHVEGGLDKHAATAYVNRMEREGRLYEECWS